MKDKIIGTATLLAVFLMSLIMLKSINSVAYFKLNYAIIAVSFLGLAAIYLIWFFPNKEKLINALSKTINVLYLFLLICNIAFLIFRNIFYSLDISDTVIFFLVIYLLSIFAYRNRYISIKIFLTMAFLENLLFWVAYSYIPDKPRDPLDFLSPGMDDRVWRILVISLLFYIFTLFVIYTSAFVDNIRKALYPEKYKQVE